MTLGMFDPRAAADVEGNRSGVRDPKAAAQPVELPAHLYPPRGARNFLAQLYGTAGGAASATAAPKLTGFSDDFQQTLATNPHWAPALDYDNNGWEVREDPARKALVFDGHNNGGGASRVTSGPLDATTALLTFDLLDQGSAIAYGYLPNGEHNGPANNLSVVYEDHPANWRLRYRLARLPGGGDGDDLNAAWRLDLVTERSEGGPVTIASAYSRNGPNRPDVRRVRLGFNPDGTARFEVLRTAVGVPEQWEGLQSVALPDAFVAAWNPAAVLMHVEDECAGWTGAHATIASMRGTFPVGASSAPADLPTLTRGLVAPVGTPDRKGVCVPNGMRGVLDRVNVALLVLASPATDPGSTPHAVADCWVTIRVDGAPVQGLAQIRPSALGAGQGAPAGAVLSTAVRPALELRGGQQVSAEITVRDSSASHPVEVTLTGWTYEDAGA